MSDVWDCAAGDIVRATRFLKNLDTPVWVQCLSTDNDHDWHVIVIAGNVDFPAGDLTYLERDDTFDIIPPDEVPDHIMAALMKLNLGSE